MASPPSASSTGRRQGLVVPVAVALLGLSLLLALQLTVNRALIEDRLGDDAARALARSGVRGITASVAGRDVTLSGTSVQPGELQLATTTVSTVDGVRRTLVDQRLQLASDEAEDRAAAGKPSQLIATISRGRITLSGAVPTAADRERLISAAEAVVRRDQVVNQVRLADGVADPEGTAALTAAVGTLHPAANGWIELVDGVLSLFGSVPREESRDAVLTAARRFLPDTTAVVDQLAVEQDTLSPDAQRAQRRLAALPDLFFLADGARLSPRGQGTVSQAARILAEAPRVRVRVEGYADTTGSPEGDQRLSQSRAAAVRDALLEAGVAPDRVDAVGRGATGAADPERPVVLTALP